MSESQEKTVQTGTLGKLMAVLEAVAQAPRPPRFTELLQQLAQPRGTLHRQLSNLLEEGLLRQRPDGAYELGVRLLNLAAMSWSRNSLRQVLEPLLRELQARTGETVHLAKLQGAQVVYLDKVESQQSVRMHSQIGNASPVYCTGVGKAMLARLPDAELDLLLPTLEFRRYTAATLPDVAALRAEIALIREQGFAEDREEHESGIRCVAAAIVDDAGQLIAGVSATAPVFRLIDGQLAQWQQLVTETAREMGRRVISELGPRAKR